MLGSDLVKFLAGDELLALQILVAVELARTEGDLGRLGVHRGRLYARFQAREHIAWLHQIAAIDGDELQGAVCRRADVDFQRRRDHTQAFVGRIARAGRRSLRRRRRGRKREQEQEQRCRPLGRRSA